jgi:hypothetical protein
MRHTTAAADIQLFDVGLGHIITMSSLYGGPFLLQLTSFSLLHPAAGPLCSILELGVSPSNCPSASLVDNKTGLNLLKGASILLHW